MFHRGNENHLGKILIKIGAALAVWVTGIAILATLGVYAVISLLVGTVLS